MVDDVCKAGLQAIGSAMRASRTVSVLSDPRATMWPVLELRNCKMVSPEMSELSRTALSVPTSAPVSRYGTAHCAVGRLLPASPQRGQQLFGRLMSEVFRQ